MIAGQKLAETQDNRKVNPTRRYRRLNVGDLVLVWDVQLAKEKGKKWEPHWSTPRILERISKSGVSGHIHQLHDPPGKTKRYNLDDLIPFVTRSEDPLPTISAIEYTRDALGDVQGN